jgi:hypothetical protein
MKKLIDELKEMWDENPLATIAVGAGAVYAVSRLIGSFGTRHNYVHIKVTERKVRHTS